MGAQAGSRLFQRLILGFEASDDAAVVRGAPDGRSLAKSFKLVTDRVHRFIDLLAQRLV